MADSVDAVEIAKKQRYLTLLKKVKGGQTLSNAEIGELAGYEDMAKKKNNKKAQKEQAAIESPFVETSKQAGKYCGVTDRTIRRWVELGMTRTPEGYYIKAVLDDWKEAGGRPGSAGLFDAKDRKVHAEANYKEIHAKMAEMDLKVAEGKYIAVEDVEAGRAARILAVKRALLGLGRRLAPQLAGMTEPRIIEATINECMREVVAGFAGDNQKTEIRGQKSE